MTDSNICRAQNKNKYHKSKYFKVIYYNHKLLKKKKSILSSYLDKYAFLMTWKARFKFRNLKKKKKLRILRVSRENVEEEPYPDCSLALFAS